MPDPAPYAAGFLAGAARIVVMSRTVVRVIVVGLVPVVGRVVVTVGLAVLVLAVAVVVAPDDGQAFPGAEPVEVGGDEVLDASQALIVVGFGAQREGAGFGVHGAPTLVEGQGGVGVGPLDVAHPRVRHVGPDVVVQALTRAAADGVRVSAELRQVAAGACSLEARVGGRHTVVPSHLVIRRVWLRPG